MLRSDDFNYILSGERETSAHVNTNEGTLDGNVMAMASSKLSNADLPILLCREISSSSTGNDAGIQIAMDSDNKNINPIMKRKHTAPDDISAATINASQRVPCKARGMGEDHTAANAYFLIGDNPHHGKLLVCSHPACVESGRRFRYCALCHVPCAKRNFSRRHSHGGMFWESQEYVDIHQCTQQQQTNDGQPAPKRVRSSSVTNEGFQGICSSQVPASPTHGGDQPEVGALELTAEEVKWVSILSQRPKTDDTIAMSCWMATVIKMSETFHSSNTSLIPTAPSCDKKETWLRANDGLNSIHTPSTHSWFGSAEKIEESRMLESNLRHSDGKDIRAQRNAGPDDEGPPVDMLARQLTHRVKRQSIYDAQMLSGALGDLERLDEHALEGLFD